MQFIAHYPPAAPEELRKLIDAYKSRSNFFKLIQQRFKRSVADVQLLRYTYDWNATLFRGKRRLAGGSYMNQHLVPVAILGVEYHGIRDAEQIVAYLTHDAIEDFRTTISRCTIVETFGERVAQLVWGATKPIPGMLNKRSLPYLQSVIAQVETGGPECVFMKCNGDRLQNTITLHGTPQKKRWKLWESEQFYIPLARKYGFPVGELQLAIKQQRERLHINDFA